jgi:hypothetical protein
MDEAPQGGPKPRLALTDDIGLLQLMESNDGGDVHGSSIARAAPESKV